MKLPQQAHGQQTMYCTPPLLLLEDLLDLEDLLLLEDLLREDLLLLPPPLRLCSTTWLTVASDKSFKIEFKVIILR